MRFVVAKYFLSQTNHILSLNCKFYYNNFFFVAKGCENVYVYSLCILCAVFMNVEEIVTKLRWYCNPNYLIPLCMGY